MDSTETCHSHLGHIFKRNFCLLSKWSWGSDISYQQRPQYRYIDATRKVLLPELEKQLELCWPKDSIARLSQSTGKCL